MESVQQKEAQEKWPEHECLIFFMDRPDLKWWDYLFTRKGFRHCFMVQWDEWAQRWLMFDWRLFQTDVAIMFDFEVEAMLRACRTDTAKLTVVRFWAVKHKIIEAFPIKFCSNTLCRFLGLGNWPMLTPWGLYRTLRREGGEVIYSWRHQDGNGKRRPNHAAENSGTAPDRA